MLFGCPVPHSNVYHANRDARAIANKVPSPAVYPETCHSLPRRPMSITDTTIAPRVVAIDPGSYARPLEAAQAAVEEAYAAWNSIIGGQDNLRVHQKIAAETAS